jgi:hypothetical protein
MGTAASPRPRRPRSARSQRKRAKPYFALLFFSSMFLVSGAFFAPRAPRWACDVWRRVAGGAPVKVEGMQDLPEGRSTCGPPYTVRGIPDYTHRVKIHAGQKDKSCFRMVGFGNRLFVCADLLAPPESIGDILTARAFTGHAYLADERPWGDLLRKEFKRSYNQGVPAQALVVMAGYDPERSSGRFVALTLTCLVCILSLWAIIHFSKRLRE